MLGSSKKRPRDSKVGTAKVPSRFSLKKKKVTKHPLCGCALGAESDRCCSAYRKHFLWFVRDTLGETCRRSHLFTGRERNAAAAFLALSVPAQELYARLYGRRKAWFFGPHAENPSVFYEEVGTNAGEVEKVIAELESNDLIESLKASCAARSVHAQNDIVVDAIRSSWSLKQARCLARALSPSSRSPSPTLNKSDVIDFIARVAKTQRNLLGMPISLISPALKVIAEKVEHRRYATFRLKKAPLAIFRRSKTFTYPTVR